MRSVLLKEYGGKCTYSYITVKAENKEIQELGNYVYENVFFEIYDETMESKTRRSRSKCNCQSTGVNK